MIRINLLPPEFEAAQSKKEQQILFGGAGGIILVFLIMIWFVQRSKSARLDDEIAKAQTQLATYQTIVAQIEKIEQDKQKMLAKRDVIRNLNRSRLIYPVFFEDILPIMPSDVWVTSLSLAEQGESIAIQMSSNASSNFAVATWLTNLQQSPHFSGVELGPISYLRSEQGGPTTLSFNLNCTYRHQGPFPLAELN